MRKILINHLLEPPGRVTGITRFLFSMTAGLLRITALELVLATTWEREALPAVLRDSRLEVVTVPFEPSSAVNVIRQNKILPRLMREQKADCEFNANPIGGFTGRWPRVITVHDLYYRLMPEAYLARHRATWRALFPLVALRSDAILVPSESTRADLARFYPRLARKATVVHEAPAMTGPIEARAPRLQGRHGIMVGNISPNKNAGAIVEAVALLAAKGINVPILHVGRDEAGVIAGAMARLDVPVEITSVAGIDDAALHSAFTDATFFINASFHEGFCLPLVEAQQCGTPVIASNRSALPEVAGEGALLVDPSNPAAIAAAIQSIWTDPAVARSLSERGKANAARFSWDKAALSLAAMLESVCGGADKSRNGAHVAPQRHVDA